MPVLPSNRPDGPTMPYWQCETWERKFFTADKRAPIRFKVQRRRKGVSNQEKTMAKIKHIPTRATDVDAMAKFFVDAMGMKLIQKRKNNAIDLSDVSNFSHRFLLV